MHQCGHLGHNLGSNVERLRREQDLSKTTFAHMSGISRPFLNKIERGTSNPNLSYVQQLADALSVAPIELLLAPEDKGDDKS